MGVPLKPVNEVLRAHNLGAKLGLGEGNCVMFCGISFGEWNGFKAKKGAEAPKF